QEIGHVGSWEYSIESGKIWGSAEGFRIYGFPPVAGDMDIEKIESCIIEREMVHQALVDLIKDGSDYNLEFTIKPADDSPLKVIHSVARIITDENGNPLKVRGVIHDISDLKRNEISLRETNAYLENLISNANVPIIIWDAAFRITRLNHAFEILIGRSAEDLVGKSLKVLFPPDQVERSMRLIQTTFDGVKWVTVEMDILHREGSIRTLLWNSSTLYSPDKVTPIATIAQGQDITDQRRLELEKNTAIGQIEKNLAQLATLNDEIRNPLTVISMYADMVENRQMTEKIINQVTQIDMMINQVDRRWNESEKILAYLRKHYKINISLPSEQVNTANSGGNQSGLPGEEGRQTPVDKLLLIEEVQAQLFTILDSTDALVYVADMNTHEILFMNRKGRSLFGDITGKKCYESMQNDQNGPCPFCTNHLLIDTFGPSGVFHWEYENTKSGRWFDCRDRAIRWTDGRLVRLEIATDITERKQTEEILRQKIDELSLFNTLTISRELRMVELKSEINSLLKSEGKLEKYQIDL
ncbi:MAG: hypothetical protein CVV33_07240, partial [Methanomicrobiales archaeon HGW-Methanomicrobiales-4]